MALEGRDVWVKTTDKKGKSWTAYHRVFDVGLFMRVREAEAAKNGGSVEQVLEPKRDPRTQS